VLTSLILPVGVMALVGWGVPRLLAGVFPEGARPLIWLGVTAFVICLCLSGMLFAVLYRMGGEPLGEMLAEVGLWPTVWHFAVRGAMSAIVWLPVMILSTAGLPAKWTRETW
jgi:hypothetical protein